MNLSITAMQNEGISVENLHKVDHKIPHRIQADTTEAGYNQDEEPFIYKKRFGHRYACHRKPYLDVYRLF
jgi:hypothetical protein